MSKLESIMPHIGHEKVLIEIWQGPQLWNKYEYMLSVLSAVRVLRIFTQGILLRYDYSDERFYKYGIVNTGLFVSALFAYKIGNTGCVAALKKSAPFIAPIITSNGFDEDLLGINNTFGGIDKLYDLCFLGGNDIKNGCQYRIIEDDISSGKFEYGFANQDGNCTGTTNQLQDMEI